MGKYACYMENTMAEVVAAAFTVGSDNLFRILFHFDPQLVGPSNYNIKHRLISLQLDNHYECLGRIHCSIMVFEQLRSSSAITVKLTLQVM